MALVALASPTVAQFASGSGTLEVGGVPIDQLAMRIGSTPFFAYDRSLLDPAFA